jgi:hypothetical protein
MAAVAMASLVKDEYTALVLCVRGEAPVPVLSGQAARALHAILVNAPGASAASIEAFCTAAIPASPHEDWIPLAGTPHVFVCRASGRVHACTHAMPPQDDVLRPNEIVGAVQRATRCSRAVEVSWRSEHRRARGPLWG